MTFGQQINFPVDIMFWHTKSPRHIEYVRKLQSQLQNCYEIAQNNINYQHCQQKSYYDRKQNDSAFNLQDQVYMGSFPCYLKTAVTQTTLSLVMPLYHY